MEIIQEQSLTAMVFYEGTWARGLSPFHWHDKLELLLPLDRPLTVLLDGERYEAGVGDIVLIGPQAVHAFYKEGDTRFLLGQFSYSFLCSGGIVPVAVKPVITAAEIAADPLLAKEIEAIVTALTFEKGRVARGEPSAVLQSLFAALYFLLSRHFPMAEHKRSQRERQDFYRIVSYVNAHYTEPITVGSIAGSLYIDRGKLSRLFLMYAGQPLTEYVTALRIAEADRLLRDGATVTAAALESGFQSVRTFHDAYSRTMHMPPRAAKGKPRTTAE